MMIELNQRQKEICDYAEEHGRSAASEHFGISLSKISYITQKRRRLDEQARTQETGFVMIGLGQDDSCTKPMVSSDSVSFMIGRAKIEIQHTLRRGKRRTQQGNQEGFHLRKGHRRILAALCGRGKDGDDGEFGMLPRWMPLSSQRMPKETSI